MTLWKLIGNRALSNANVREGLEEHFVQMRAKSIESEPEWMLEAELQKVSEWNEFLKCPFGLERNELWFYHQVRSGTLHTKTVLRDLYEPLIEIMCAHCGSAPETITHLLVECDEAKRARKELVEEFKAKLDKMEFMRPAKLKIWFDDVVYDDGKLVPLSPSRSTGEILAGLMGKEDDQKDVLMKEPVVHGRKKRETKVKRLVNAMKRSCIKRLHKVWGDSVAKRCEQ